MFRSTTILRYDAQLILKMHASRSYIMHAGGGLAGVRHVGMMGGHRAPFPLLVDEVSLRA